MNNNFDFNKFLDPTIKVICLDLDETLIHATRIACNNSGNKQLKYWGRQIMESRKIETERLLKQKPLTSTLNDTDYLKATYGPQLFANNLDIASPYLWSFPADDFSKCWTLVRCCNNTHSITSFYRIEYRPYCQNLIQVLQKLKKQNNAKIVISTLATRRYGLLVAEGLQLFKGYFETIDGVSTPLIDKVIGLEDWRENCWNRHYPQHYGKKSFAYIKLLFGVDTSQILCIDDKPEIWTNTRQVISIMPFKNTKRLGQIHNGDDNNNRNNTEHKNNQYNGMRYSNNISSTQIQEDEIKEEEEEEEEDEEEKQQSNSQKKFREQSIVDDVLLTVSRYFEWYLDFISKTPSTQRRGSWPQQPPSSSSTPLLLSSFSVPDDYRNAINENQAYDHNYNNIQVPEDISV